MCALNNLSNNKIDLQEQRKIEMIRFVIENQNDRHLILLTNDEFGTTLSYVEGKNLENKKLNEVSTPISSLQFNDFYYKLEKIIALWNNNYSGNNNSNYWELKISSQEKEIVIKGTGDYPYNWNDLIDLVSEYEILFKYKMNVSTKTEKEDTLEDIVKQKVMDPFFVKVIVDYFEKEVKMDFLSAKHNFYVLSKYDDILSEFTKYLIQKTYDIPSAISIAGYTANRIYNANNKFNAIDVYTFLSNLRDDPERISMILDLYEQINSINNSDIKVESSDLNKEIDKYLDELKPEVDKELRNLGLLKIDENGNEYPVLGCCHTQWDLQKKLLKERYGIDWKNPAERSPFIDFD